MKTMRKSFLPVQRVARAWLQVKLPGQLEPTARWPHHFNNISAIRGVRRSHSVVPPQPRGVNSRSQISPPARLIHHPFCLLLSYSPQSAFLADILLLYTHWINTKLTTQRWRNRFQSICPSFSLHVAFLISLIEPGLQGCN